MVKACRHLIWFALLLGFAAWGIQPVAAAPIPDPIILSATADELLLRWEFPPIRLERASSGMLYFNYPGWLTAEIPGQPALPYATALVVLPPTGEVTLNTRVLDQNMRLLRAPLVLTSIASPALWELPNLPPMGVTFTELGVLRGVRLGQLTFVPLEYDPITAQLTYIQSVELTLHFTEPLHSAGTVDAFNSALHPLVLNPQQLAGYPQSERATKVSVLVNNSAVQFQIAESGIFALPWSTLEAAGVVTPTSDPAYVRLLRPATGVEVALHWDSAGQRFLFYADPQPTRWADFEVYKATYAPAPGIRMTGYTAGGNALPSGMPWAKTFSEEERVYESRYPSPRNGDHWYWHCLERPESAVCPTAVTLPLPLETPISDGPDALLTVWLYSYTNPPGNPNHRLTVNINGTLIGETTWASSGGRVITFTVPTAHLHPGDNTIQIALPGLPGIPIEGLWIDAAELYYPLMATDSEALHFVGVSTPSQYMLTGLPANALVFDVSNPDTPLRLPSGFPLREERLGSHHYYVVTLAGIQTLTTWTSPIPFTEPAGADYLVLAPTALLPALAPWLDFHAARGLSVFVAPTEALYDHYGDGRMAPEALKAFVAHAYAVWDPRPRYLLLVGDATWDPLDHLHTGSPTLLPPYLTYVDPWLGEIPTDNRYATVDGVDALPDLAVGRFPVNTPAELTAVIEKIIAYAETPFPGDWNTQHLFVADDPDPAGNFPAEAEFVNARVPISHTVTRLYCTDDPDDVVACGNLSEVRQGVLQGWNGGALVINWVGHSAFQQWEHGRLFHTDDLRALVRAPRYPLSLALSCFTGNFAHPDPNMTGMDEALVRLPQSGAIAAFGNSGMGLGSLQTPLHQSFYLSAMQTDHSVPPGIAASVARAAVANGAGQHLVDSYHFFGDPALPLAWEAPSWVARLYLPLALK
jgi:hypothetical protein